MAMGMDDKSFDLNTRSETKIGAASTTNSDRKTMAEKARMEKSTSYCSCQKAKAKLTKMEA
eukprot:746332-Hanusia_phi.AAC.29